MFENNIVEGRHYVLPTILLKDINWMAKWTTLHLAIQFIAFPSHI